MVDPTLVEVLQSESQCRNVCDKEISNTRLMKDIANRRDRLQFHMISATQYIRSKGSRQYINAVV